ncbi:hypothetical protein BGX31_011414 [Mortierella sp. GBA43]|nr:hypothetical protein BGX31_011414 [Mortierella sp. GBA43]
MHGHEGDNGSKEDTLGDEFDSAVHLPGPFYLLLVNKRFADAAIPSLWRNIVFHGQDAFQIESLISTLSSGRQDDDDDQGQMPFGLGKVKELNEDENDDSDKRIQVKLDRVLEAVFIPRDSQIQQDGNPLSALFHKQQQQQQRHNVQGIRIPTEPKEPDDHQHWLEWLDSFPPRHPLIVFTHKALSTKVVVLECLQQCCPDQILALDVHVNEKMKSTGFAKPEEMERLFGSGFSALRYLRLQGGFVDNQLLYALIKGLSSPKFADPAPSTARLEKGRYAIPPTPSITLCRLSQVFLGPGSVTDSAVEKLIGVAGHSLEVFVVTSCVDVGGGTLADLLTKCPKLRVIGFHRSLARDRELLEGLGIEVDPPATLLPGQTIQGYNVTIGSTADQSALPPRPKRKTIVAPLERLELGMVKLTRTGIAEILKGTCQTLRFLVLESQHFSEQLLTDVIMPYCTRLEGLHFDDPEHLQKQQQQMQGLGFSAGRRGAHLPNRQFEFGRAKRTFYSDPNRPASPQPQPQSQPHTQPQQAQKVSAWLGETSTDEWIEFGDCALWTSAASPGVSFDNGGPGSSGSGGGGGGGGGGRGQHPRRQPLPLFHVYHNPMMTGSTSTARGFNPNHPDYGQFQPNYFTSYWGEYDDVLDQLRVSRRTVDNLLQTMQHLVAFTVMQLDFIRESQELTEIKAMMRQDELRAQSMGFRALKLFYVCLFLSSIYFGGFRW